LLRRTALVVEGDDALGWPHQIGHDESDTRVKLAGMPLDLGHDPTRLLPALRLIAEAGVVMSHLVRRSPDRRLSRYPILHKILPARSGKFLNELHTGESRQLVGACVFEMKNGG
jgi:hypothetical protein